MATKKKAETKEEEKPAGLPVNAHTYYVFKGGNFVKFFTNEQYKGDAQKFAQQFADEIGGTLQA